MTPTPNAIILAGGQSTRLGEDKALLPLRGVPLLTRAVRRVYPLAAQIIISGRSHLPADIGLPLNIAFAPDVIHDAGPLVGIYTGLLASAAETNIVTACDMPFVSRDLLALLLDAAASSDTAAVVPESGGEPQVTCAVYKRSCLDEMQRTIETSEHSPRDFLKRISVDMITESKVRAVDPDGRSFFNINTKDDLRTAEQMRH